jgi:hypothetical protein
MLTLDIITKKQRTIQDKATLTGEKYRRSNAKKNGIVKKINSKIPFEMETDCTAKNKRLML